MTKQIIPALVLAVLVATIVLAGHPAQPNADVSVSGEALSGTHVRVSIGFGDSITVGGQTGFITAVRNEGDQGRIVIEWIHGD